jgi:hypothetical protein
MYEVKFYRDKNGKSEIVEYLDELKDKGETSKNERINRDKILVWRVGTVWNANRPAYCKAYGWQYMGTTPFSEPNIFLLLER